MGATLPKIGERSSFSKTITDADIRMFSDLTGDHNAVHLDDNFAKSTRFGGRIVHGVFALGLISAVLGTQLPGPGTLSESNNKIPQSNTPG